MLLHQHGANPFNPGRVLQATSGASDTEDCGSGQINECLLHECQAAADSGDATIDCCAEYLAWATILATETSDDGACAALPTLTAVLEGEASASASGSASRGRSLQSTMESDAPVWGAIEIAAANSLAQEMCVGSPSCADAIEAGLASAASVRPTTATGKAVCLEVNRILR